MTKIIKQIINTILLNWFIFVIVNGLFLSSVTANENNSKNTYSVDQLRVTPERCVALRQGQVCYQHVVFDWQAKRMAEYCLFKKGTDTPINCWSLNNSGRFTLDFQSAETKQFILKQKNSSVELASAEVVVAWVYGNKKRRRASWRLF